MSVQVSLFASAVRPKIWPALFKSLEGTSVEWEVVFAGNCDLLDIIDFMKSNGEPGGICNEYGEERHSFSSNLHYIHTKNIKPATCYELSRRQCKGEVVVWSADDMEFPYDVLGRAYRYWKEKNNKKIILSLQTKESGYGCKDGKLFPMKEHTFFSLMPETPLMAPVCMMSREYLNELGGLDVRYVCGQYENDIVMRAYADGATVEIFGDENCYVDIDHLSKSIAIGESNDEESFRERPFAKGYEIDRQVLENSWTTFDQVEAFKRLERGERPFSLRKVSPVQLDKFQPYPEVIPLDKSISNKGKWD